MPSLRLVIPVAKTGLHCGACQIRIASWSPRVIPVAKTGLHCGDDLVIVATVRVGQVIPVAKTGLHCGQQAVVPASGDLDQ